MQGGYKKNSKNIQSNVMNEIEERGEDDLKKIQAYSRRMKTKFKAYPKQPD